jgi:hypothetical protein
MHHVLQSTHAILVDRQKIFVDFRTRTLRFDSLMQPRLHSKPSDCRINDEQESGKNA